MDPAIQPIHFRNLLFLNVIINFNEFHIDKIPKRNVPLDIKALAKGQCCFLKYIPINTRRNDRTGQE
jgi:hypothetical protein